jgi:hypothetical protein
VFRMRHGVQAFSSLCWVRAGGRGREPPRCQSTGDAPPSSGVTPVELRFTVLDSGGRKRLRRWVRGPIFGRASSDPTRVRHQVRTVAASRRRPQGTAAPWSLSSGLMHAPIGVSPGAPRRGRVVHPYRRVPPPPRLRSAATRDAVATPSEIRARDGDPEPTVQRKERRPGRHRSRRWNSTDPRPAAQRRRQRRTAADQPLEAGVRTLDAVDASIAGRVKARGGDDEHREVDEGWPGRVMATTNVEALKAQRFRALGILARRDPVLSERGVQVDDVARGCRQPAARCRAVEAQQQPAGRDRPRRPRPG